MKQRIMTGILAGALYIAFLLIGSVPFAVFITAIAVIAYTELAVMKKNGGPFTGCCDRRSFCCFVRPRRLPAPCAFSFFMAAAAGGSVAFTVDFGRFFFRKIVFILIKRPHLFFSAFYIGFAFFLLVHLRFEGLLLVFFIQIVIWSTDSGAYFVGRKWGKTKLAPHISPNKTIEGAIGAIIVALIIACLFQLVIHEPLFSSWWLLGVITVVISVFGQLGDLAESAIKRYYQVKDSGKILPGHGGLFDRFDSLIFILPILYLIHVID
ncbi:phosphatidate cytidylyltransferase [Terrilactibacillus sp. S3-3]|nr:phosphatidate cytidylyltransferase [Terrilactibacillus sp. S3-3]